MSDDSAIQLLDEARKHGEGRSGGVFIDIDGLAKGGALFPGEGRRRIDGFLHVGAVEIDCCSHRRIGRVTGRETENAPE